MKLALGLLVICVSILSSFSVYGNTIVSGQLDLHGKLKSSTEIVNLEGRWIFLPFRFLQEGDFQTDQWRTAEQTLVSIPGDLKAADSLAGLDIEQQIWGTLVLEIKNFDPSFEELGLRLRADTAYSVYWYQRGARTEWQKVMQVGVPGPSKQKSIPQIADILGRIRVHASDKALLVIHLSGFHYSDSSIWRTPRLGSIQRLERDLEAQRLMEVLVCGMMLIMALYFWSLTRFHKEDAPTLWLAWFTLLGLFRLSSTSATITSFLHQEPSLGMYYILRRIEFGVISLFSATGFMFIARSFGYERFYSLGRVFLLVGALLAVLCLVAPVEYLLTILPIIHLHLLSTFIFDLYVNGKACFEKKSGSLILLIGVLSVVFCGIYDSGIGLGWVQSSIFLSHFGATVLIFCQGLVNAKLFAKTFKRAQRLTNHLKEEVESQTYELRRQKEEIEAQKLALSHAHVQLQEIDQTKTAFFRQISHELRTPLTLILGSLNLAIQSADWLPNARVALRNSRRLLRLVNQLLDFQRITQSRHAERQVVFDVPAISRTIAGLFGPACLERRVDFAFVDQGEATGELLVLGQVDALEKITFNYLSNALKHSMEGGKIFFRIYRHHEFCRLEVEDTGPGIPVTELDKLFRTFARIQDADGVIRDSTGIGLALCRELTEAMGGQVGVRSELGKGSVFWADLPLANRPMEVEVALAAESLEEAVESLQHRAQIHLSEFEGSSDRTQIVEHPSILGAPTILVVDDQIDLRILIQRILVQVPYNVLEAGDGQEAFAILQRIDQHVDLVLADWMMPRCNGPELVKKMKSSERYRSVPVVLLTAKGDADARTEAVAVGANSYLSKPFDEVELLSTIANLLRLKQKERELIEMQKYLTQQVLQRFLPSSLVNKILAGEAILEQKPRMLSVTVMFSDLCGFTSTTEELGPRRVAEVLNEFLVEMTEVVFAFGGTVDKFIGDAILVVFGAPEELDAAEQIERASRCAIEMVKRLKQLNVGWEEKGLPQFRMRVGIHHGPNIVGSFGGPKRSDFTVIGHAVNIASRVQGVAEPNSIFVTQIVRDFLSHDRWEDAGRHRLKGVSQEIHLYRLKI